MRIALLAAAAWTAFSVLAAVASNNIKPDVKVVSTIAYGYVTGVLIAAAILLP